MPRDLKIAPGGVAAEMGLPLPPRRPDRRCPDVAELSEPDDAPFDEPETGAQTPLGEAVKQAQAAEAAPPRPSPDPDPQSEDEEARLRRLLVLRPLPGRKLRAAPGPKSGVRVYHREPSAPSGRCWAFTISRAVFLDLQRGGFLRSKGATYPDGQPVVPEGHDPSEYEIHCGTCGTSAVEARDLEFFEQS